LAQPLILIVAESPSRHSAVTIVRIAVIAMSIQYGTVPSTSSIHQRSVSTNFHNSAAHAFMFRVRAVGRTVGTDEAGMRWQISGFNSMLLDLGLTQFINHAV